MQSAADAIEINFEDRLARSKGRSSRNRVANARVTEGEQKELEAAAKAVGKALSEWARETLLREARRSKNDALFTEIVAIRMLLVNLLKPLLLGKVSSEQITEIMTAVKAEKQKVAQEVMQQYTAKEGQ
jgi:uncharacterized protein (DUF1778 family)